MNNVFGILIVNYMLYNTLPLCLFQVVLFVEILKVIKKNLLINHVFSQAKPNFMTLKKKNTFKLLKRQIDFFEFEINRGNWCGRFLLFL